MNRRIEAHRTRDGGFMLTETLATFTISAFVLLCLVSASSLLLGNVDRSVAHIQEVDDLGRTMKAIERDIASLVRARWDGNEPQGFVFRGGPNSLYFAHADRNEDGMRHTRVIALREIVAERGTRLVRAEAHLSSQAQGFDALHYGPQRELGMGAARLRFFYVAPTDLKMGPGRLRQWRAAHVLPAAIIVEAIARDTGQLKISMRVPIQANADIGCLAHDQSTESAPPPPGSMAALDMALATQNGKQGAEEPRSFCGREVKKDVQSPQNASAEPVR